MAHIAYVPEEQIPLHDRVPDTDPILRIHGIHSKIGPLHYRLYRELMHFSPG
ncbi:hypothetical protein JW992_15990 [candidate division KSB1 bacterium]|nr:hypothetical protein [candidate division KSB1 bacterium]